MYGKIAVEFHDQAAHFKELLCTYSSGSPGANPDRTHYVWIREGHVEQLSFTEHPAP
jgi:hypothetical protein